MRKSTTTTEPAAIPLKVQRQAAADSDLDVRTIERVIRGQAVRPICRERAVRALAAHGVDVTRLPAPAVTGSLHLGARR
jgi:ribosomal protein S11